MLSIICFIIRMIGYAIDPYIFYDAGWHILKPKYSKKVCFVGIFLGIYILALIKQMIMFSKFSNLLILYFPLFTIYCFVSLYIFCDKELKDAIILAMELFFMSIIIDILVDVFVSKVCSIPYFHEGLLSSAGTLYVIGASVLHLLIYKFFFLPLRNKRYGKFERNAVIFLIFLNIAVSIIEFVGYFLEVRLSSGRDLRAIYIGALIGINIPLSIVIIEKKKKDREKIVETTEQIRLMESQLSYAETVKELGEEIRKFRHDYAKHMGTIGQLIKMKQYDEAKLYVEEMNQELLHIQDVILIENPVLSAVITEIEQKARKYQITFQNKITVSEFPLNHYELSTLVYHILENAIDACKKVEPVEQRSILFEITKETDNTIFLYCKNHKAEPIRMNRKGKIEATKAGRREDGNGISIMEGIVKKYEGSMEMRHNDTSFEIMIWIPPVGVQDN